MAIHRVHTMVKAILAGAPLLVFGAAAHAQAADAAADTSVAAAPSTGAAQLQEVVVTAARRTQNLQNVTASVSVVTGAEVTRQGMINIADVVQQLPSVQATGQPGGFSTDIRGLGGDLPAGTQQGSVALEFDGIYNINSVGATVGFFDVKRIEVMAGPQSTLYGPDADGGVVNVITNDPVIGSDSGNAAITVGNYGLFRTELAQNIPLTDKLAARIAVATVNQNSYFTPAEGNDVAQSIRAKLLYVPTDGLSIKLQYQLDHVGGTGTGSNIYPILTQQVPPYMNGSINDYSNLHGGENVCATFPPPPTGGPWTTGLAGNCFDMHEFTPFYQDTEELRLHSTADSRIDWDLGFYHWNYYWGSWWPFDALPGPAGGTHDATQTNAVYGQITYPLSDALRLIGGLRESFDERRTNFGLNGTEQTPTLGFSERHFDYRAGLQYQLSRHSMEYFTAATGYRPGGLNQYLSAIEKATTFGDETNTALELGSKNTLLHDTLQLDADVFYYITRGYQDLDKYSDAAATIEVNGQSVSCNADNVNFYSECQTPSFGLAAHALGFETQLRYNPTARDRFRFSATVLDARFDAQQGSCAVLGAPATSGCWDGYTVEGGPEAGDLQFYNMAGAVQPHSPRLSGSLDYEHVFALPDDQALTLGANAFFSSGYYVNPVEDPYGWQPAYWLEGVSAGYIPASGHWQLSAYAHNLANYAVKESVLPATTIGPPRTVGLVISTRW